MNINHVNKKGFLFIYLGIVFIYTLLLGLQGFDMTDEGWCLSGYLLLFENPSAVEPLFLCYNSVLVGAIWNYIFGSLGIWGFRLLSSLCTVLIALVVYEILYKVVSRWIIFLGMMIILFSHHFVMVFHHNLFSAALCCISVCFMLKSVNNKNELYSVLAGIFIGLNFFTRLPNVTMLSLFIVYIVYGIHTKEWKRVWVKISFCICGILIGITLMLLLMQFLGHLSIYFKSLSSLFTTASSSDSNHGLSNLLRIFFGSYYVVLRQIISICSFPCIAYVICTRISKTKIKIKIFLLLLVFTLYICKLWVINRGAYTLYAFSFISLFIYFQKKMNIQEVCLVVASILVMFFLPLGSDGAIENMGSNCLWLSFPLSLGLLFKRLAEYKFCSKNIWLLSLFAFFFITSITIKHLVLTMTGCCSDSGLRYEKIWRPNHPLITVRTEYEKCEFLDDLFNHLNPYVEKGAFLLCWQSVPMIHYLTHTYPYLNNPWPWTMDAENLEKSFSNADKTHLPVVLCNKSAISMWYEYNDEWDSENAVDQWNFNSHKAQIFHRFLQNNGYYIVWENDLFRILLPPSY